MRISSFPLINDLMAICNCLSDNKTLSYICNGVLISVRLQQQLNNARHVFSALIQRTEIHSPVNVHSVLHKLVFACLNSIDNEK